MEINDEIEDVETEDFDENTEKRRTEYNRIIKLYIQSMEQDGLAKLTISRHCECLDLFLNEYLAYEHEITVQDAVQYASEYFGYTFIRDFAQSADSIKTHAASIKRFYKWLLGQGLVTKEGYAGFCRDIGDSNIRKWKKDFEQYYDLTKPDPFMEDF
ncbi:MAG: hypothetical protein IJ523_09565 [Succinivibrionaceae bacterium]|nr:hypothetical protein [Succinivibrionaceae bacterium]